VNFIKKSVLQKNENQTTHNFFTTWEYTWEYEILTTQIDR